MINGQKPRVLTVPESGHSGNMIRPEIIRAMESQQKASQSALDELHELAESVRKAFKLGLLRAMGE